MSYWLIGNWLWRETNLPDRAASMNPSENEMLLDVVAVEPQHDGTLILKFENGEKRRFDMKPLLDRKPFAKLKNSHLFMRAAVGLGTVVWPGDIDIAPETLWDKSVPV